MKTIAQLAIIVLLACVASSTLLHSMEIPGGGDEYREPWLEAYAGLGYYNWVIGYGGKAFDNKIQPFILKKFEIRSNLRIIQFGLNYFTNRFDDAFDTTDENDAASENDQLARQLAMFAGLSLGPVVVTTDAKFRKFQGTLRSNGVTKSDGTAPVRLFTDSGYVDLPEGMETTWYSLVRDYSLKVGMIRKRKPGANVAFEFGGRMVNYSTPAEIEIRTTGVIPEKKSTALFESKITQYFVGMSFWINYTWKNGMYWEWSLPAFLGANKIENSYLDMGTIPYTFSSVGKLATGYRSGFVRIEMGLDYDFFGTTALCTSKLNKDVEYYSTSAVTDTIPAGSKVTLKASRMELFWGIYLHATLML